VFKPVSAGTGMTEPLEERYFERRQIKEAIAFAEAGGIAIHRNFDYYHGSKIRGMTREKPFLHVIGLRPVQPSRSSSGVDTARKAAQSRALRRLRALR
jgi:hypothetical protein